MVDGGTVMPDGRRVDGLKAWSAVVSMSIVDMLYRAKAVFVNGLGARLGVLVVRMLTQTPGHRLYGRDDSHVHGTQSGSRISRNVTSRHWPPTTRLGTCTCMVGLSQNLPGKNASFAGRIESKPAPTSHNSTNTSRLNALPQHRLIRYELHYCHIDLYRHPRTNIHRRHWLIALNASRLVVARDSRNWPDRRRATISLPNPISAMHR